LIASVASSKFTASCVHGVERRAPDQATRLSFADGQCCVKQDDREVRISIEDLAWAVIDTPQATLASALMAEGWQSFNRGPPRDGGCTPG